MSTPKIIIITGRPGSGKTTLAKELGRLLFLPVVSRDEIKEGYVNTLNVPHGRLPTDANKIATGIFFRNIEFLLSNNVSLVAEAAFQHKVWEPEVNKIRKYAAVLAIICEIDAAVAANRHVERGINNPKRETFHGDKRVLHFRETGVILPPGEYEAPSIDVQTIRVLTVDGYEPTLTNIADRIRLFLAGGK
jgi:predicted kinase